jgi:hypothetical protein
VVMKSRLDGGIHKGITRRWWKVRVIAVSSLRSGGFIESVMVL